MITAKTNKRTPTSVHAPDSPQTRSPQNKLATAMRNAAIPTKSVPFGEF